MPTREQVMRLLDSRLGYEEAARRLGVPAGQAYMIATGLPADGGGSPRPAGNPASPTAAVVARWLKQRAADDKPMRRAAARRQNEEQ
ncbi:hypothetical protein [Streptomyces sp. NRRL F-5126]|uniref:hypothetical protein n=1 Tax=Streptomyces sp. NRRL F-5126 TaxID=1463857 RepID=UPI00068BE498|nr:hypothetical protein [Streptomyces sp. NRRL F-5126]